MAARLQSLPASLEPGEQDPGRDGSGINRQTVLGACHQNGCCHHAQQRASKWPKALLTNGRNFGLRPNYLKDNQSDLCVNTDQVAYWGSSAGAYTVLQVGYALNQYAIERPDPRVVIDYWGGLFGDEQLEVGEAPFFVLHGTADTVVSYQEAVDLTNRADVVAVPYALYTVNGAGHGFGATGWTTNTVDGQTLLERTGDFVEAHLTGTAPIYGRFELP